MKNPFCRVIRSGSEFIVSFHADESTVLVTEKIQTKHIEHAEAIALSMYPEATAVNNIDRPGHITFNEVPANGKIPHEKARVQKPLDSDDCAGV